MSETVKTDATQPVPLDASRQLFIRRWGEMGGYWGINRTMAEIHALLFVSNEPVCTDDVMERLLVSRGTASTNLRALVDWGLIERVHLRGDRREYFLCRTNVWEMLETIIQQRRRREVEPIVETIDKCLEMVGPVTKGKTAAEPEDVTKFRCRLEEMQSFLQSFGAIVDMMVTLGPEGLERVSGMMTKMMA
ncbi:MAG: MarR family transcriptional regulator [Phycisphaerales bacterium]|nr:MarR family transcriptional regulator [Phycisphaerales bacterium]MCB9858690.1 MarR family transcriptional regulator [Phycisphaerales bacterium]MCB9864454.1 MarR family transcriptional regulator [Phycisphaerales bacterium]